ncbi:transposase DNA-binding-containing protein [Leptospira borgpetersenii]|uniref:transposase DNA-binding-containing protein n=1 Tax=Leptospira borgpetersenii TaxID=174 RepID=UPI0015EEBB92
MRHALSKFLKNSSEGIGGSIPFVSQDWSSTKAAYRFLSNDRVSEKEILGGHFQSTQERCNTENGPILILHGTTEFSFKRKEATEVGFTRLAIAGKYSDGRLRYYTASGILMHSSLSITADGLPLGLASIKFWNRKKFKGCKALKKKINPTRMPIEKKESFRWLENLKQSTALLDRPENCVHIGDRESDIYELFCLANQLKTNFLVRSCVDRLAIDGIIRSVK